MQAAPLITEELLDEDFFAELDALIDKDFEENKEIQKENRNCGTGAIGGKQGFQPGNKCAGDGSKSKAKAEGKKKDVHSDWDDGKTAGEAGWYYKRGGENIPGVEPSGFDTSRNRFVLKNTNDDEEVIVQMRSGSGGGIHPRDLVFSVNGSQSLTNKGRGVAMNVIREVANRTASLFQDENVPGLIFTADMNDGPGRAKLYKRMSEMLAKKYDGLSFVKPSSAGNFVFAVVKESLWGDIKSRMEEKKAKGFKWKKSKDLTVKKLNSFFDQVALTSYYDEDDAFDINEVSKKWDKIPDNTGLQYRFMEVPDEVEKTYFFDELLNDESFMQEIERMFNSIETRNCGTGAVGGKQGFQPGNKCAGDGSKSKAKAEGKKKDVHSDWDDGATSDRYWDRFNRGKHYMSTITIEDETGRERDFELLASRTRSGGDGQDFIGPYLKNFDSSLTASPVYSISFGDDEGRMKITGRGGAQKVFREVVNRAISFYDNSEVGVVRFSADRVENSRVKLYDFLSKFAAKRRGAKVFVDNNRDSAVVFHIVKPKYAEKYDEWYRKKDNPLYPIDTFEGEY